MTDKCFDAELLELVIFLEIDTQLSHIFTLGG